MFDVGWTEMALIAGVAVVVVGPKDLPQVLYQVGKFVRKIRVFTSDMQQSLDKIMQDVEVDEIAKEINTKIGGPNLQFEIERQIQEEDRKAAMADVTAEKAVEEKNAAD